MKILVPMWYYSSGYAGSVSSLNLTMTSEELGFEAYKAFTTDDREYMKFASTHLEMENPYINSGTQGGILISSDFFTDTSNLLYLYKDDNSGFSSPDVKYIQTLYGDGDTGGGGQYIYAGASPITGTTKTLAIYNGTEVSYQYFRFTVAPAPLDQEVTTLTHGIVYDMPDTYRIEDYSTGYEYRKSRVYTNLLGTIYWDGLQNNLVKRTHVLEFQYLNEAQKDELIAIFELGKGILPVWFIDDTSDNDTWMYCAMKTASVTEEVVDYYTVILNLEEY